MFMSTFVRDLSADFLELVFFCLLLFGLSHLIGSLMFKVFKGEQNFFTKPFQWLENLCYTIGGIEKQAPMNAKTYAKEMICFNLVGFFALFFLLLLQGLLPLNSEKLPGTSAALAFNIASSFITNTNWQSYTPETTLSYFTQMSGLAVQNFLSAATGIAVLVALIRGLTGKNKSNDSIGNFWVDLIRSIVYILLPLSLILAILLLSQGVIQSFSPYLKIVTLEGAEQIIPFGPVASQVAIKQLGTNGGGFFNANSAHPFENPTALSNFFEVLAILLIPSASIYFYSLMTREKKHSRLLYLVVVGIFLVGLALSLYSEHLYSQNIGEAPLLEGKEVRIGNFNSLIWSTATTAASNGSTNAMLSSLSPLAGGVCLFNIMTGEVIFGGIGVGLCSLLMFVLMTVFLSGLMVGRTPEYMGKKIEVNEMVWITVAILIPSSLILVGTGISSLLPIATDGIDHIGPHGFSTLLYAFSSAAQNNGSAFANLNANTPYYNLILGLVMLIGRFATLISTLMIAGLLVRKKISPPSLGTFSTNSPLFAILLFFVIVLVGALTFFPALCLGPLLEHLLMMENHFF